MKILVNTLFNCSATGTTGNFRSSEIPYKDRAGNDIRNHLDWTHSRNKQRNWETLLQLIGLRCQVNNVEASQYDQGTWHFTFEVDTPEIYGANDSLDLLRQDCRGVPMVCHLDETPTTAVVLITLGEGQNIWFEMVNINYD